MRDTLTCFPLIYMQQWMKTGKGSRLIWHRGLPKIVDVLCFALISRFP